MLADLHIHTTFSDGIYTPEKIVAQARASGITAIAITDHGVVQAFPEANHCFDAWGGVVPQDSDFKVIYGVELIWWMI